MTAKDILKYMIAEADVSELDIILSVLMRAEPPAQ